MGEKGNIKRSVMTFFMMLLFSLSAKGTSQIHADTETVRVGWFQSDMFQEGMSDGEEKSGYCYDYLRKVASYTNWKYEYVYGDWTELFNKLKNGEIDFLGGVSQTSEREEYMSFPDTAMGTDQYYLFKHDTDSSISASDLSTLSGKKVGGIVDNRTTIFTLEWMENNNVDLNVVYYESFDEQEEDFLTGKLDLLGQTINNVLSMENISIVAKVGEEPFYMAVNKNKGNLLKELNDAVAKMISNDPYILQNLQDKNYGATLISKTLSNEENAWVEAHPEITVGYLDECLPYSDMDEDGSVNGAMKDVLNEICESLNLDTRIKTNYKKYTNYSDMVSDLSEDKIDIAFPVYDNQWYLEKDGIDASNPVIENSDTLFYKGNYSDDKIKKIAVNKNNKIQEVRSKNNYPSAEIVYYSSTEECLKAVMKGNADGTLLSTLRTSLVTENSDYKSLSYIQLTSTYGICFGVDENNTELLLILNRGLKLIGDSYGIEQSYKYMNEFYHYTALDFMKDHIIEISFVTLLVVGVVVWLLLINLRKKANYNRNLGMDVAKKTQHINKIQNAIVFGMANMIENRDENTGGHVKRTSDVIKLLIEEARKQHVYDISIQKEEDIVRAAPMHDLGKISIDTSILCKPGRLTPEEYEIMKTHAAKSGEIVHMIFDEVEEKHFVDTAFNIARYHHERWDGKGYPDGMKGEEIPFEARIMAVADVYDALVSERCYKKPMSFEEAAKVMNEGMGSQFDAALKPVFNTCREKLEEYYKNSK